MQNQTQTTRNPNRSNTMNTSKTLIDTSKPILSDYHTGEAIRNANILELIESRENAETDGGAGVILVDCRRCFVRG